MAIEYPLPIETIKASREVEIPPMMKDEAVRWIGWCRHLKGSFTFRSDTTNGEGD